MERHHLTTHQAEMLRDRIRPMLHFLHTCRGGLDVLGFDEKMTGRHGFGRWAVEVPGVADFIGFVGLTVPEFDVHFTPCVEVGWRLAREHWGLGYASEAARAALAVGFRCLALDEIVSFTVPANRRSRGVMERIGMTRTPAADFDHPVLPVGHPLQRHVLYRIRRPEPVAG